jgi:ABC-2 type transport system permease protein
MNRLRVITAVEFRLFFRSQFNVIFVVAFPMFMLLMNGSIYGNKPVALFGGHGTVDVSVPAYACMIIAITGLLSLPLAVARYRERKILKRFMATPIHPLDILLSQVLVNLVMAAAGMLVLIVLGKIIFDLHIFGQALPIVFSFILIALSVFSIGLVIAGVIPDSKASTSVSFLVYFPMLYLSGAIIPAQILPKSVAAVAKFLPLTHGVNLLEGVWMGRNLSSFSGDILILLAVFIVFTGTSIKLFRWEGT